MVRTVKSHREDDDVDDEEFGSSTPDVTSQKVKLGGKTNDDQKVNALRSKHSETEQRRRSKINERFQVLRDLIPENDQKRDKASFLLEVIQYIHFLQEKIQMYEGTYQDWNSEPSKLTPWRSDSGLVDNLVDPLQVARNGSSDGGMIATLMHANAQTSMESELSGPPLCGGNDNSQGSGNHESSLNMSVQQPNLSDVEYSQPARASFPDPEPLASQSPSDYWCVKPCASECALPSDNACQQEQLKSESGINRTSNDYSQGLLKTLTHALQSSGVDLSHTKISVQLDVGKRTNGSAGTTLGTEDSFSFQQMAGRNCNVYNYDRPSKKPRSDGS
ncbi:OLC1v1009844C1 [Oldenlandia corymbosa var. corymbosa]|uniref:OLC1v1009844C1 n=1 Tax=Oldenlandia corymbosa var. corymbosa TaxID=529605 RepID=A0AAV1DPW6_OLDCO|nr:OLC1v1009844C1 [Oldenlandia corymbosa var. corymbosa]